MSDDPYALVCWIVTCTAIIAPQLSKQRVAIFTPNYSLSFICSNPLRLFYNVSQMTSMNR